MQLRFDGDGSRATDLPAWNDFAHEVEQFVHGGARLESVQGALERLDLVLGRLELDFHEDLPFRESTAVLHEATIEMDQAFDVLRLLLASFMPRLEAGEGDDALELGRAAVQRLCEALARLRKEDEAAERYSESSWVHDLCRVGRAWLRGRLPRESFRRRLEGFEEYHRRLREGLEAFEPLPREKPVLEAQRRRLEAALDAQEQAVAELQRCVETGEEEPVLPALEAIRAATADMVEVHRLLLDAAEREEERPCPRCGAGNPVHERFCAGCGSVLPRLVLDEPEAPRLDLLEGGGGRPQYEHLVRLVDAAEKVRSGEMAPDEFESILDDMEARLIQADRQFARVTPPPAETPPDQMDLYRSARQTAQEGQYRMAEALALMRDYLGNGHRHTLDRGLEHAMAAGEQMAEFERLFQRVLEMANS